MAKEEKKDKPEVPEAPVPETEGKEAKPQKMVEVPHSLLLKMQEDIAEATRKAADAEARAAGVEELLNNAPTNEEVKLKKKNNFAPKFRTVRIRKFPIAGDFDNMGYVIGWTNKGAYQEVDRTGVSPSLVDMIDIIFLGQDRTADGKIKAEKVRLLDLLNKGEQVHCKILNVKEEKNEIPTGEEISVKSWDPHHGLVDTGELIDGYIVKSDIKYTIQIPGVTEPVIIDGTYVN